MTLDNYLSNEFSDFDRERRSVDQIIYRVVRTLEGGFDKKRGWPYEISLARQPGEYSWGKSASTSTAAMVAASLATAAGYIRSTLLSSHVDWQPEDLKWSVPKAGATVDVVQSALKLILSEASAAIATQKSLVFRSRTFGADDVFTLCWLADLATSALHALKSESTVNTAAAQARIKSQMSSVFQSISTLRPELCESEPAKLTEYMFKVFDDDEKDSKPLGSDHSFPLLRLLQLKKWVFATDVLESPARELGKLEESYWQSEFGRRIHEQLSFHAIPDSRFDPAELTFSLEALAVSSPTTLDRAVVIRILDVLVDEQRRNPTLRPAKPVKSDATGSTLFPVSVEIFNSLLRISAVVERKFGPGLIRDNVVSLCRRYFTWVQPRLVQSDKRPDAYGWHSEHINNPQLIHPWETSQILLFLLGYRTLVDRHLAEKSAQVAGLSVRTFPPQDSDATVANWEKLAANRDPISLKLTKSGTPLTIYESLGREFVRDHASGRPIRFSMILYGPPGTGKTSLAEELARALGYSLVTVTVSDFLAEGGLQIEARAKAIFSVLAAQKRSVIIFDEIDHLLLNRDSQEYKNAESNIQLMVPGMLTKIKDLRSVERSIFVIATNYEERIDGAIKRPGRIDRKYLVMPPDWQRRTAIIKDILGTYAENKRSIDGKTLDRIAMSKTLLARTARMSHPEIRALVHDILDSSDTSNLVHSVNSHRYPEPVANLDSYLSRLKLSPSLAEELEALEEIVAEAETKAKKDLGLSKFRQRRQKNRRRKGMGS